MKIFRFFVIVSCFILSCRSFSRELTAKEGFSLLHTAYPEEKIEVEYDREVRDWYIRLDDVTDLYWADGRLLPKEKLGEREHFDKIFYAYPEKIPDPKSFTEEDVGKISRYTAPERRKNSKITSPYFWNTIFSGSSKAAIEPHLKRISFLNRKVIVHEKIVEPLQRVETKIRKLALSDRDVQNFIDTLMVCDGYYWRSIADSPNRSFHSFALAVDLLPIGWKRKAVYWNWARNAGNDRWMLIPLEKRWIPPAGVIASFEEEGFLWGGKWVIWDNMHFEYRPEILAYQKKYPSS